MGNHILAERNNIAGPGAHPELQAVQKGGRKMHVVVRVLAGQGSLDKLLGAVIHAHQDGRTLPIFGALLEEGGNNLVSVTGGSKRTMANKSAAGKRGKKVQKMSSRKQVGLELREAVEDVNAILELVRISPN